MLVIKPSGDSKPQIQIYLPFEKHVQLFFHVQGQYLSISSTLAVFREEERSAKMSLIPVSGVVDVPSLSPELGFWLEMAEHILKPGLLTVLNGRFDVTIHRRRR